ncbi:hypothetical protein L3X38_032107 [Prunus dulcis]|uniref:Uncharacterized protein n=1 Tax=Prunus dulcis TaxID=3755 RepID=A0AAD4YVL3_PRUDU|nr:hypothetical protein L3X38_032107 [Prunus dulcis]
MTSVISSPLVPQVLKLEGMVVGKAILCEDMPLTLAHRGLKEAGTPSVGSVSRFSMVGAERSRATGCRTGGVTSAKVLMCPSELRHE